ncbi:DUF2634 domain-containing protein [Solibacillus sp. FSL W8-0474]|uniref:contractile injection system sheath initiator n=1 Tax=Solibacillus sp. FSL W8-0474 TaxID=2975336 RepID=UPI0030FBAAF4
MQSFKIDPLTNDIILDGQNNIVMVSEDEEIIQCVERVLTTNLGEWFLNPDGLGWDRYEVLGKKHNPEYTTDLLYAAILQETRIASVEKVDFEFNRQGRALKVYVVLIKANGERLEGEFDVNGIRV